MKLYRVVLLLLLFHHSPGLTAQDTTRAYYGSGKLRAIDVKLDSTHIWERAFYESGSLQAELTAQILPGSEKYLIEAMKQYYEDGVLSDLINDSVEIRYDPDGSIFRHSMLKDHQKNGLSQTYLDHKLWLEVTYKDNKKEGWMISYDSAQTIISRTFYRNDQQSGPTSFYRKGILTKKIEYENGCPIKAEYFDVNGRLLHTIIDKKAIWMEEGKPIGCK